MAQPELTEARAELATLHEILAIIRTGRMLPEEWPKAKSILDYLDGKISAVQAKADALAPPESQEMGLDREGAQH